MVKTPTGQNPILAAVGYAIERSRAVLERQAETRRLEARFSSLSVREREVLALVVSGLLNKQVGYELGISEITVKAHRGRVMRKMKASSLPQLVNMAASLKVDRGGQCVAAGTGLAGREPPQGSRRARAKLAEPGSLPAIARGRKRQASSTMMLREPARSALSCRCGLLYRIGLSQYNLHAAMTATRWSVE